jgi:hypothetical protein
MAAPLLNSDGWPGSMTMVGSVPRVERQRPLKQSAARGSRIGGIGGE